MTRILQAIDEGDPRAADELLPLVYEELRVLAARRLARENPGRTLQATALVHEAYLRLVGRNDRQDEAKWDGRGHFFAAAAEAMRRILVEQARRARARKRGGGLIRHDVDGAQIAVPEVPADLLALDEALTGAGAGRPAPRSLGRTPVLRGPDPQAGRRGDRRFTPDRRLGLGLCQGVLDRRVDRYRALIEQELSHGWNTDGKRDHDRV